MTKPEKSIFLKNTNIHSDWHPFFTEEILKELKKIEDKITKTDFTPPVKKVLRFFELPLRPAKIIILGQDPYPQPGAATGRAFEVGTLQSWSQPFRNISLKNILRAMYRAYFGKVLKYSQLKERFDNEFPVLPPTRLFKHWEKQGILLLNTSFTCVPGKPASHQKIWNSFTTKLLEFTNEKAENTTWFLWGNHAAEAANQIIIKNAIFTQHPMMCYSGQGRETDFLFGQVNCFEEFINRIDWTGYSLSRDAKASGTLF